MRKYFALIIFFTSLAHAGENSGLLQVSGSKTYSYELSNPSVRITLPNLPQIEMEPHPLNAEKPHLRVAGNAETINVSIFTPTAESGMTALDCASASATSILAQSGIEADQVFKGRSNENTYLLIYGYPLEEFVLLNAHILSASKEDFCIEVHVSKLSNSDADVQPWFNGFGESNIEEF